MSRKRQIDRLSEIGGLILDVHLTRLKAAAKARADSLDRLAGLDAPGAPADIGAVAGHQAEVRYQAWADARRCEINLVLARQTATLLEARDAARHAFGQAQALRALRDRR